MTIDRTDAPLIRHLAKERGPKAAAIYNALPLLLLPEQSSELIDHSKELINAMPDIINVPFDDFLLDFPFCPRTGECGRLLVRVRRVEGIIKYDEATYMSKDAFDEIKLYPPAFRGLLLIEGWEENTQNIINNRISLPPYPDMSIVPLRKDLIRARIMRHHLDRNWGCADWCNTNLCSQPYLNCWISQERHEALVALTLYAITYITEGFGGAITEVSYSPKQGSREEKSERKKPWTVPRRSTFILIDPSRAKEYGHPSGEKQADRQHSSPVPHQRRGHYRKLSENHKTWVRPTWIGVREWRAGGRTYKIVSNHSVK
jgi:hypothetical protein